MWHRILVVAAGVLVGREVFAAVVGQRVAPPHLNVDFAVERQALEELDDLAVAVAEHRDAVDADQHVSDLQAAVAVRCTPPHDTLNLEQLPGAVPANYGEAEALGSLGEHDPNDVALEFGLEVLLTRLLVGVRVAAVLEVAQARVGPHHGSLSLALLLHRSRVLDAGWTAITVGGKAGALGKLAAGILALGIDHRVVVLRDTVNVAACGRRWVTKTLSCMPPQSLPRPSL